MPTPHNSAKKGDIAKTVLMPGDPLRAEFIANTYLENVVKFNTVRGMLGFTGTYKGKPVSVMGSGMGIPSIGIYSYELFTEYDVDSIVRIGSCGAYAPELKLYDVLLVTESFSESSYARYQNGYDKDVIAANPALTEKLRQSAKNTGHAFSEGRIHSNDIFYRESSMDTDVPYWQSVRDEKDCLAAEMESFALFHNANVTGKQGACLLTVSDSVVNRQETTAEEREKSFTNMMEIALGVLLV